MTLRDLIDLRNQLDTVFDVSSIQHVLDTNAAKLQQLASDNPSYKTMLEFVAAQHLTLMDRIQLDRMHLQQVIDKVHHDVDTATAKYFQDDYQLRPTNPAHVRDIRHLGIPDLAIQSLESRINLHSQWKYPCLEIGCDRGFWTHRLVASDPLYLADYYDELLEAAISQFEPIYQSRVRRYRIDDYRINGLPENQFGFIFSFNFFNYLSLKHIKNFLSDAMHWLRPGGTMLFTYNNADIPAAAGYAESHFMSYAPKSLLVAMCHELGFEVEQTHDYEPAFSWIEIRKPGVLDTVKAAQVLGEIKHHTS